MDDRFSSHPLWEHDVDLAMEGLEKYVLSVPEVCAPNPPIGPTCPPIWFQIPVCMIAAMRSCVILNTSP
jgi:hypothetical protein